MPEVQLRGGSPVHAATGMPFALWWQVRWGRSPGPQLYAMHQNACMLHFYGYLWFRWCCLVRCHASCQMHGRMVGVCVGTVIRGGVASGAGGALGA